MLLARFVKRLHVADKLSRSIGTANSTIRKINSLGRLRACPCRSSSSGGLGAGECCSLGNSMHFRVGR